MAAAAFPLDPCRRAPGARSGATLGPSSAERPTVAGAESEKDGEALAVAVVVPLALAVGEAERVALPDGKAECDLPTEPDARVEPVGE
jgi:hypothetical protein